MGGYTAPFARQQEVIANELGLNAEDLSAGPVSEAVDTTGFNQGTVSIDLSRNAATTVTMYLDVTSDLSGTPTWRRLQTGSVSSGTETMSDWTYTKTVSADDNFVVNFPLNYKAIRMTFAGANSTATDLITVNLMLGVV